MGSERKITVRKPFSASGVVSLKGQEVGYVWENGSGVVARDDR